MKVSPAALMTPEREAPLLVETVNATVPGPVPLSPLVIVIHGTFAEAVHEHVDPAVTAIEPVPPAATIVCPVGRIAYVHDGVGTGGGVVPAASVCETVIASPATVNDALRAPALFGSTVKVIDPLPVPDEADVMWIHPAWLTAVHPQLPVASIVSVTAPPAAPTATVRGDTVNRHSAASCETVAFEALMSIVAWRGAGSRLAATRYATEPSPWPVVAEVMTIQGAALDAAQVQSRLVATATVPEPPAAPAESAELVSVTLHFDPEGPVSDTSDELQAMVANSRAVTMA